MTPTDSEVLSNLFTILPHHPYLNGQLFMIFYPCAYMEKVKEEDDVAESFVAAFYHDSEDENITDQNRDEDIFELYWNSRPLTPLERGNPEGSTTDRIQYSEDPSGQICLIGPKLSSHENGKNVREDVIISKSDVEVIENTEENAETWSSPRTTPQNEISSEVLSEEKTPVEGA